MKILITGATDGIGLATAKLLAAEGHHLLIHGRSETKLQTAREELLAIAGDGHIESYKADLSILEEVEQLAKAIQAQHKTLDVIINNAGIFKTSNPITAAGYDVRFVVNTIAPYILTQRLLPLLSTTSRVINLSSAAQAPVNINVLLGKIHIADDFEAYAQSKLAITIWSQQLAALLGDKGPVIIPVNPGSMLGSKMVQEGFGVSGGDINVGAKILVQLALATEFEDRSGQYFDNDKGAFAAPHPEAQNQNKAKQLLDTLNSFLN